MSVLLDAALEYAVDLGWPVVPLAERAKVPKIGRATGGRGLHDATTDEKQIRQWWGRWPEANIGLRTGIAFDVVDVDGREGQESILEQFRANGSRLHDGPWSATGGGGDHFLYLPSGHGNRAGILPHVDYRGEGGYIVAPPSIHPNGEKYEWIADSADETRRSLHTPLEPLPDWIAELVAPATLPPTAGAVTLRDVSRYAERAFSSEVGRVLLAPEGQRNHTLNAAAFALGQLVAGGCLSAADVAEGLLTAARRVGLGEIEAEATITSGLRAGLTKPRQVPA
jgi:hypothetical protein